jgi:hypothetical protein
MYEADMTRQTPRNPRSLQRLLDLFTKIEDENIREIIADIVIIENRHRSSSKKNFPWKDIRDVVDRVALLEENKLEVEVES